MTVELRLLGAVGARVDGREVELGHARQRSVLAALLVDANAPVPTDRLVERVWADRRPQRARNGLFAYMSRLRQALRALPGVDLARTGGGYLVTVDPDQVDLHRFRRLLAAARGAAPQKALALYTQALDLWQGEPFTGLDTAWFETEREALRRQRFAAELDRNDAGLALGRHTTLLVEISASADANPLDERLAAQLILALYRCGRQADALEAYQRMRRRLADELGTDPSPQLQHLYRQLLTADPVVSSPVKPRAHSLVDVETDRLLGRDSELDRLHAALAEVRTGHGRLVMVSGEPGIGKTELVTSFAAAAADGGVQVLVGRAAEEDGAPSFWPWLQIVRAWRAKRSTDDLPEDVAAQLAVMGQIDPAASSGPKPPTMEPAAARFRLFDAVASWLRWAAAERPTVVVIDDLHRADAPSQLLLRFLTRGLDAARCLVVAAYRDPPAPAGLFAETLAKLVSEPVTDRLELDGLDPAGVARLIERVHLGPDVSALASRLHERTSGNPFFVRELVHLLRDQGWFTRSRPADAVTPEVPTGVRAVVRQRLSELPPRSAEVLAAASVLGREFDIATLALVCAQPGAVVLELLAEPVIGGLVHELPELPGQYRFSHILVRDALYAEIPAARRAALHKRAGTALEAARGSAPGPHLSELAHHYLRADPQTAADAGVEYAVRAGARAVTVLAYEDGADLFARALRQPLDDARRCKITIALGDAQMKMGLIDAGRATFEQAADVAELLNSPELLAEAALGFGAGIEFLRGEHAVVARLIKLLERATAQLAPEDSALRALLLSHLTLALYLAPVERADSARVRRHETSAQAVAMARRLGEPAVLARAVYARLFATWGPENVADRIALSDELLGLAEELDAQEFILAAWHWQIVNALETGDVTTVDRRLPAYRRVAAATGQPQYQYWASVLTATRELMHGHFDEAEALCLRALAMGRQMGSPDNGYANGAAAQLQAVRWAQGRLAEMEPMVAQFVAQIPDRTAWRMALVRIYASMGRADAARQHFEILADHEFRDIPRDPYWLTAIAGLADVCLLLRDAPRARTLYRLLQPFQGRFVVVSLGFACVGSVDHFLGQLARAARWPDRADEHLRGAFEAHHRVGLLPALARTCYARAELAADAAAPGDHEAVDRLFAEAARIADGISMGWLRDQANRRRSTVGR